MFDILDEKKEKKKMNECVSTSLSLTHTNLFSSDKLFFSKQFNIKNEKSW